MALQEDVSEFLTTRRARVKPQDHGLPVHEKGRRVPGLRREEVAALAGISVEYYIRIERGRLTGISDSVIEALMNILMLNQAERKYFQNLVDLSNDRKWSKRKVAQLRLRPELQQLLDSLDNVPAIIRNGRMEILASNSLGAKLYSVMRAHGGVPINIARYFFIDPEASKFFLEWESLARETMGSLRAQAALDPSDKVLNELIEELSTSSSYFRKHWSDHAVHEHTGSTKRLHHPQVGDMTLFFQALALPGDDGLRLNTYLPEKGSPSEDALRLLAMTEIPALRH